MSPHPKRVRCAPLGREERVATVVDEEIVGDTRGPRVLLTVSIDGHRFRVHRDDVEPV
jgi:hypothetical protein